jgi:mannose-6-phosphate isomerase-like protein (cupin superfamily)
MSNLIIRVKDLPPVPNVCDQVLREVYKSALFSVAHVEMAPGNISLLHEHTEFTEVYYILSGEGVFCVNGHEFPAEIGATVGLLPGMVHQLKNTGTTVLKHLVISNPPFDPGDVKIVTKMPKRGKILKLPSIRKERGKPFLARDGALIFELFRSSGLSIASGYLKSGQRAFPHFHDLSEEIYFIIVGSGEVRIGNAMEKIEAETVACLLRGSIHALRNTSRTETMKILAVSSPPYADDDMFFV